MMMERRVKKSENFLLRSFDNDGRISIVSSPSIKVRVTCGDITELDVDGFVFFARPNLELGSGLGGMIARRGGAEIQRELREMAPKTTGEAVLTSSGKLKVRFIVHSVGPVFHEEDMVEKLKKAVMNALLLAEKAGAKRIALPPMGTGFYRIPVEMSASVLSETFQEFAQQSLHLKEIIICVGDPWMVTPYERLFQS